MINNFYSSISNGNRVETCKNTQHHSPEPLYLLKTNFLSEFRTRLEKAKARASLGIGDAETLEWKNIQGEIAEQPALAAYLLSLLSFDWDSEKDKIELDDNFLNIHTLRDAAIVCLKFFTTFSGEKAEIDKVNLKIKNILLNLYAVDTLEEVDASEGGVINDLTRDVQALLDKMGNPETTVEAIENSVNQIIEDINIINNTLTNINSLIKAYQPTEEDWLPNALQIIEKDGQVEGLYVADLSSLVNKLDEDLNGENGKISLLLQKVEEESIKLSNNIEAVNTINTTTVPEINALILDVRDKYVSKASLDTTSPIITRDTLTGILNDYIVKDTIASVSGLTTKLKPGTQEKDPINIDVSFNVTKNVPLDPRHYVLSKADLLTIDAWTGMEVIVIENSLMYICTDAEKSKLESFEAWKPTDSLRIEVVTLDHFKDLKENGQLNDDIYYFIYLNDITYKATPELKEYWIEDKVITDDEGEVIETIPVYDTEAFNKALEMYEKLSHILLGQYMSAAWGEDFNTRLYYKADKYDLNNVNNRLKDLEAFFGTGQASDSMGSLQGIKESIATIYTPAIDGEPESGILVSVRSRVEDLEDKIETLEEKGIVTWDLIGAGNSIVVESLLENYVSKNSEAPLNGITSQNDSIVIKKPLTPTFAAPLDSRHYVSTLSDLFSIPPETAYEGMEVIVKQDALIYMLKDKNNIALSIGWEVLGASSIVELTLEEYSLRKDNTNPDGTSKGHKYEDGLLTGYDIPTILEGTYYFIKEEDINVPVAPNKNNYIIDGVLDTDAYAYDLEAWRKDTYVLLRLFMSASWGTDMEVRLDTKAAKIDLQKSNGEIKKLQDAVEILNSYFEGTGEEIDNNVRVAIADLRKAIDDINTIALVERDGKISRIENSLYGNTELSLKPEFVTWAALGGDGDELEDGKTLFVKTTTYENDRELDSLSFKTNTLKLGEGITIKPTSDRITVNSKFIALKDDLVKAEEFESYELYFNWINGKANFKNLSYEDWCNANNPDEWYFVIKNVNGSDLPEKEEEETLEEYEERISLYKKGMFLTIDTAEKTYATQVALSNLNNTLLTQINSIQGKITSIKSDIADAILDYDSKINSAKLEYTEGFTDVYDKLKIIWGSYYKDNDYVPLDNIINEITVNIKQEVKTFATEEIEKQVKVKLNKDIFDNVWAGYYTDETVSGITTRTYRALSSILDEIKGGESELSLTSLKNQIDLKENKEDHDQEIESLRTELKTYTDTTLDNIIEYTDTMDAEYYQRVIDACNNSEPITYNELVYLKTTGNLTPGKYYRIMDYETTTKLVGTAVVWHPFNLIVLALNAYTLSEDAYASKSEYLYNTNHPIQTLDNWEEGDPPEKVEGPNTPDDIPMERGDIPPYPVYEDFYYKNCNLTAWKIRYCLDNDVVRYGWADDRYTVQLNFTTGSNTVYKIGDIITKDLYNGLSEINLLKCSLNGKGVIYYMQDEFGNECGYDFKSIVFDRYKIQIINNSRQGLNWIIEHYYSSLSEDMYKNWNKLSGKFDYESAYSQDPNVKTQFYTFNRTEDALEDLTVYNANNGLTTCRDNKFSSITEQYNVLGDATLRGNILPNNVFIGSHFYSNTVKHLGFVYNTLLDGFSFNTLESNFAFNIFGADARQNTFGNECKFNVVSSTFGENCIGNEFSGNVILVQCRNNTFGDGFNHNFIDNYCLHNNFSNGCINNTFCANINHCEFSNNIKELRLEIPYLRYCKFSEGMHFVIIHGERGNSGSWYLYINFNVVHNSQNYTLDLDNGEYLSPHNSFRINTNNNYITVMENTSSSDLCYIWCPANLVLEVKIIRTTLTELLKTVSDLEKNFNELVVRVGKDEDFENQIASAVMQIAERTGVTIDELTRDQAL